MQPDMYGRRVVVGAVEEILRVIFVNPFYMCTNLRNIIKGKHTEFTVQNIVLDIIVRLDMLGYKIARMYARRF